jgi:heptaprenyl diphosphate synthase
LKHKRLFNEIKTDLKKVEKELDKFLSIDDPILKKTGVYLLEAVAKECARALLCLQANF